MMHVALFNEFGVAEEVIEYSTAATPSPKEHEVLVRMIASPIHNHNILTIEGRYGYKPKLPAIGGSGAVGVITQLGEKVSDLTVGDKVICTPVYETWAEYFISPAEYAHKLTSPIPDSAAAQLLDMPLSAFLLFRSIKAQPGDWIIQNAANGAVGKALYAIAQKYSVNVLNLVRSSSAADTMREAGYSHVIDMSKNDWFLESKKILEGQKAVAGIDSIAGSTAPAQIISLLSSKADLISFGLLSRDPISISPGDLIFKGITLKGFWATPIKTALTKEERESILEELSQLVIDKKLQLPLEGTFPLKEVKLAIKASLQSKKKGKVLLTPPLSQ